jgi:hypothetical protein
MLTYHPALDAYHSAFRILRILAAFEGERIEVDKIRILDFLLAFPHLLSQDVRLPNTTKARVRRLAIKANSYRLSASPRLVFVKMTPLQHQAIKLLASTRLIGVEEPSHQFIFKTRTAPPPKLSRAIAQKNGRDSELISILTRDVASFPLLGSGGLKDRTNLMEFRYDAV